MLTVDNLHKQSGLLLYLLYVNKYKYVKYKLSQCFLKLQVDLSVHMNRTVELLMTRKPSLVTTTCINNETMNYSE